MHTRPHDGCAVLACFAPNRGQCDRCVNRFSCYYSVPRPHRTGRRDDRVSRREGGSGKWRGRRGGSRLHPGRRRSRRNRPPTEAAQHRAVRRDSRTRKLRDPRQGEDRRRRQGPHSQREVARGRLARAKRAPTTVFCMALCDLPNVVSYCGTAERPLETATTAGRTQCPSRVRYERGLESRLRLVIEYRFDARFESCRRMRSSTRLKPTTTTIVAGIATALR